VEHDHAAGARAARRLERHRSRAQRFLACNQFVREVEDGLRRAVVATERQRIRIGKFEDILHPRVAPAVDRLLHVAHHGDAREIVAGQRAQEIVLRCTGILELVHQDVIERAPVGFRQRRGLAQGARRDRDHVAEVEQAASRELAFVLAPEGDHRIDARDVGGGVFAGDQSAQRGRFQHDATAMQHDIHQRVEERAELGGRRRLTAEVRRHAVDAAALEALPQYALNALELRQRDDVDAGIDTERRCVLLDEAKPELMEIENPRRCQSSREIGAPLRDGAPHALTHLARGLQGKCERQQPLDADASLDERQIAFDQHAGFPRARSRDHVGGVRDRRRHRRALPVV
jgi:hypothetical protein